MATAIRHPSITASAAENDSLDDYAPGPLARGRCWNRPRRGLSTTEIGRRLDHFGFASASDISTEHLHREGIEGIR
ncbi:hypothetical protein DFR76_102742 [Nocardia pseudobrasiliensis]|uniref:Uncharacterized protein n=1 Tax=Nocardia pseudobrasiliensis TaxID=45979 RepID=A0A370IDX3_9NOCA|nr:hypothetical protein DFR76_102742 [Nocardia pseudobrasiliensis]